MPLNGVINFYKPPGMSSAQAVAFIKRLTGMKTGHAGTLDPEAAGVLPILLGKATRINDYLMDQPKVYLAEVAFGVATDTQDAQGRPVETRDRIPDLNQIKQAAQSFIGDITQVPPQYSALKVDGQTAYQLARAGKTAQLRERSIHIEALEILHETPRNGCLMRVRCGKGTYIRTLCHDLGRLLDCPAHMRFLLREESSGLKLTNSVTMEDWSNWAEGGFKTDQSLIIPVHEVLASLPQLQLPEALYHPAVNGVRLPVSKIPGAEEVQNQTKVCLFYKGLFIGIYERQGEELKVAVMLCLPVEPA